LALGVSVNRTASSARNAVAEIVTRVLADIEAEGKLRPPAPTARPRAGRRRTAASRESAARTRGRATTAEQAGLRRPIGRRSAGERIRGLPGSGT